jgi:hypothetical protein
LSLQKLHSLSACRAAPTLPSASNNMRREMEVHHSHRYCIQPGAFHALGSKIEESSFTLAFASLYSSLTFC